MKNLKMFAIALLAMLVMVCGVKAETNPCEDYKDTKPIYATLTAEDKTTTSGCYATLSDVISALSPAAGDVEYESASVKLYNELTVADVVNITAEKSLILDLNGYDVTITASNGFKVNPNAALTIKSTKDAEVSSTTLNNLFRVDGGSLIIDGKVALSSTKVPADTTADSNKKALIAVKGNSESEKTTVTIGKDVEVTTNGAGLIIYSDDSTDGTTVVGDSTGVEVNVAGTWKTDLYTISVHGRVEEGSDNPIINVSDGEFTSNKSIAFYAAGYGVWNITGGKITGGDAFSYRTGKVSVKGATLIGKAKYSKPNGTSGGDTTGSAFVFSADMRLPIDASATTDVVLDGGTFKSESTDGYAIYFESLARVKDEEAIIEINNGSYASKGKKAAIGFAEDVTADAQEFLDNHKSMITGGEFAYQIVNGLSTSSTAYPASTIAQLLTSGTDFKTEGGKVVVGAGNVDNPNDSTVDPGTQTPGEEQNPGNQGPEGNVSNPNTSDNILVYAGLGLVSLTSVAFTTRKRED